MKNFAAPVAALSAVLLAAQGQQKIWQMGIGFPGYSGPKAEETLSSFPALVTFTDDMDGGDFFNRHSFASQHGWDLRFYDANDTELDYEFDTFDPPNVVQVWVRVLSLTPDGKTFIRAEWGDPAHALEPEPYTTNGAVWVNHLLVQHYNTPNGAEVTDASGNGWVADILAPEPDAANQYADGVIGRAVNLTRSPNQTGRDNCLLVRTAQPGDLGIPVGNAWTISAWFKDLKAPGTGFWRTLARGTEGNHHVIVQDVSTALGLFQDAFCQAGIPAPNPSSNLGTATLPASPVWRQITAVGRCTNPAATPVGTTEFYIDGVYVGTVNRVVINDIKGIGGYQGSWPLAAPPNNFFPNPSQQFADYLDEFRVASVARSAAWVWADHQTQSSASGFTSHTAPIQAGEPLLIAQSATAIGATNATFNGFMQIPGNGTANVTVRWGVEPGVWTGSRALAPQSGGAFDAVLSPLLPGTEYFCAFYAANTAGGAWVDGWSATISFTTLPATPIIVVQPVTAVEWTTATAWCEVVWPGVSGAANLTVWYGTVDGGTNPAHWKNSVSATTGAGLHAQTLGGLRPATTYHYRWQAGGVWYGGGSFTTQKAVELQAATDVGWDAATLNCVVSYAGPSGAADLVLCYGTADGGADISAWQASTTLPGAGTGPKSLGLSGLDATTVYYFRWFVAGNVSEPGTFTTVPASEPVYNETWYWTGEESINWSDTNNWRYAGTSGDHPETVGDLFNRNLMLAQGSGFDPLNQDIPRLMVRDLYAGAFGATLVVTNQPVAIRGIYNNRFDNSNADIHFHNDISVAANGGQWLSGRRRTVFYGALSEFGGRKVFDSAGQDYQSQFHFLGPVTWSGGFNPNGVYYYFYGMRATGAAAAPANPSFFGRTTYDAMTFNSPDGLPYEYEYPLEKGAMARFDISVSAGNTVVFNAPFLPNPGNASAQFYKRGGGILELDAPAHTFQSPFYNDNLGLVLLKGALAPGGGISGSGSMDLDGLDVTGRAVAIHNLEGHNCDGYLRNQNPWRPARVTGNISHEGNPGNNWGRSFGGIGDLTLEGDLLANSSLTAMHLIKNGQGTLTLAGTTRMDRPFGVTDGTLALDHAQDNGPKLSGDGHSLHLLGNLHVIGNAAGSVESVATLAFAGSPVENPGAAPVNRVRVRADGAVFTFTTLDFPHTYSAYVHPMVDFAPVAGGAILASGVATNAAGILAGPNVTFNGMSFASVSDTPHANHPGFYALQAAPEGLYVPGFTTAGPASLVDLAGGVSTGAATVGSLRFKSPATLTLDAGLELAGNGGAHNSGAILVTPDAGGVRVDGPGVLCDANNGVLYVHQYDIAAPLILAAQIAGANPGGQKLAKSGPGTLVLTSPESGFGAVAILEGVLAFDSIRDAGSPQGSALGRGGEILLASATLRYTGGGHASNRAILLRGKGVLDASGAGPLTLTNPNLVTLPPIKFSQNGFLTLAGSGEGVIQGKLALNGGRLAKEGAGTWTFTESSTNSWTWGTDVFGGALVVNGWMGRDVTVHAGGTLAGAGFIGRNLILKEGATLRLDPAKGPLTVGKHLSLVPGVNFQLPPKIPSEWTPALVVGGEIKGEIPDKQDNAYFKVEGNTVYTRFRPRGTLMIIR